MRTPTSLRRKIWVAFVLQVAAISFATVLGVYGASVVLKDVLIQRALTNEAAHFWRLREAQPQMPLPDTHNMRGYLAAPGQTAERAGVPELLRELAPGFHSLPRMAGGALVLVDDRPQGRLWLVFDQQQVDALAFWFGAVPLVVVLVVIYAIAFLTYRASRRLVSPVAWLAEVVQRWDPKQPEVALLDPSALPLDVEGETLVLARALHEFGSRLERFVERERNFTRDASHELRTPLTVVRMAAEVLLTDGELTPQAVRTVQRIKGAVRDMEALTESFLILAREGDTGLQSEDFEVNAVVREEVDKLRPLLVGRPVKLRVEDAATLSMHAPPRVFATVVANLVRNACLYTEQGRIDVRIERDRVLVDDTGSGMDTEMLARAFEPFERGNGPKRDGHGIGLTIVRRLSDRFGWPVQLESEPGRGTRATLQLPGAVPVV